MDATYFIRRSTGLLRFDPKKGTKHFDPWWALLECDEGIVGFYAWLLKSYGIASYPNKLWGPHISVIKGDPANDLWGCREGEEVDFWYTDNIRWDNGKHAWLDCYSERMSEIRVEMGLPPKAHFHLTIGLLR